MAFFKNFFASILTPGGGGGGWEGGSCSWSRTATANEWIEKFDEDSVPGGSCFTHLTHCFLTGSCCRCCRGCMVKVINNLVKTHYLGSFYHWNHVNIGSDITKRRVHRYYMSHCWHKACYHTEISYLKRQRTNNVVIFQTNEIIATWSCVNCYINSSLSRA